MFFDISLGEVKMRKEKEVDYKQEIHRTIQLFKAFICRAMNSTAGLFQLYSLNFASVKEIYK